VHSIFIFIGKSDKKTLISEVLSKSIEAFSINFLIFVGSNKQLEH